MEGSFCYDHEIAQLVIPRHTVLNALPGAFRSFCFFGSTSVAVCALSEVPSVMICSKVGVSFSNSTSLELSVRVASDLSSFSYVCSTIPVPEGEGDWGDPVATTLLAEDKRR